MATYSDAVLDEIRSRVDIVDIVSQFVGLRKAGASWKGLCPFHAEKTPSFMVNPARGIFHCFGCGVGGDAFGFLMRQDRLSFPEAVRALARRGAVELPEERARGGESDREDLYRAMHLAETFYAENLWRAGGERARQYLETRGVDPTVAKRFGLGYAPDGWDSLLSFMRGQNIPDDLLEKAGLVVPRQTGGGFYDRFRGRLLFAIRDLQGRVVAFGGRAFGDEQPKYLNSPETPLYTKGQTLYAIDLARDAIRAKDRALLVEGYLDCLMAHQHGFPETVATLGTAFTPAQLALLRRYCGEVVTFFDADAAGQKAAERAEELLEPSRDSVAWAVNRSGSFADAGALRLRVALLPAGHDPDTLLRSEGAGAFEECIGRSRSLLSYALDRALTDTRDMSGARGRATAFARIAMILSKVSNSEEALALSREAAVKLGVDAAQLWIEAQRLGGALRRPAAGPPPAASAPGVPLAEKELLLLLLHVPASRAALLQIVDEADVAHPPLRALLAALRRRPDAAAEALMSDLPGDAERGMLAALLLDERDWSDAETVETVVTQFSQRFDLKRRLRRIREVSRAIAEGQAAGDVSLPGLQAELQALQREGQQARELTLGGSSEPRSQARPSGPRGVHTNG
ncbi:MAG: DNA primase [Candidatus Rokuibacteriota bacterium]|nr:MAG: DNA primase [Candidatus Rokubacteria bacterium]